MSAKDKESRGDPLIPAADAEIFIQMAGGYSGPERRRAQRWRHIASDEALQLLVEILTQVKNHPVLQPQSQPVPAQPLSAEARDAIVKYTNNHQALAHGPS
jgi:hypothetical protein